MKILIPTDFSDNAEVAVTYAANLAKKLKAQLVVFNVVHPPGAGKAILKVRDIEEAMTVRAMEDAAHLVNKIKARAKGKLDISWKVIRGFPVEQVVSSYSKNHGIDLIVMGTKGASGLKKIMWGSNAAAVISNSEVPVITIPELAKFTSIKNVVYATDMISIKTELKSLIPFAKALQAKIHVLHVAQVPDSKKIDAKAEKVKAKKMSASLVKALKYSKLDFTTVYHSDAAEGIGEYATKSNADLLAMFTHELSFFEKLKGSGVTRKLAFLGKIPLLSFRKS